MRKSSRLTVGLLAAVMAASLYSVDANASAECDHGTAQRRCEPVPGKSGTSGKYSDRKSQRNQ